MEIHLILDSVDTATYTKQVYVTSPNLSANCCLCCCCLGNYISICDITNGTAKSVWQEQIWCTIIFEPKMQITAQSTLSIPSNSALQGRRECALWWNLHLGLKNNSAPDLNWFYALGCNSNKKQLQLCRNICRTKWSHLWKCMHGSQTVFWLILKVKMLKK